MSREIRKENVHNYRPAWKGSYGVLLLMCLIFVLACLISFKVSMELKHMLWLWLCVLVVMGGLFAYLAVKRFGVVLSIRPDEVAFDTGIFGRKSIEISYQNIRTCEVTQTFMQRILNVGTLSIASSGTDGYEIQVENISSPWDIRNEIQANERAIKQRAAAGAPAPNAGQ